MIKELKSTPMVSVVIPTYNRALTIKRSVCSVLNQTHSDLEVIVVDDCSTDNTEEIVKSIKDKRVSYIKIEKNRGANYCRNMGITMAKGEYIAFQDSDDEWLPEKLEKQLKYMKETSADFCFCLQKRMFGRKKYYFPRKNFHLPTKREDVARILFKGGFISTQAIILKKEVAENVKFDDSLPRFQDWDFAIRVAEKYKICFLKESLVDVYEQNDSISHNDEKGVKAVRLLEEKYAKIFQADNQAKRNFEYAKCKILWRAGRYKEAAKLARVILKKGMDLKVLYILISSFFGLRKERM